MPNATTEATTSWTPRWVAHLATRGAIAMVACYLLFVVITVFQGGSDALLGPDFVQSTFTYWIAVPVALLVIMVVMLLVRAVDRARRLSP